MALGLLLSISDCNFININVSDVMINDGTEKCEVMLNNIIIDGIIGGIYYMIYI